MKTISYKNSFKDMVAMSRQYMRNSKFAKLLRWFFRACVAFVILAAVVNAVQSGETLRAFLFNVLFSALSILIVYHVLRYFTIYLNGFVMNMGRGKGSKGQQHLHLLDSQVQNESKTGVSSIYYDGIYRVQETMKHLFIFTADNTAYIIPKKQLDPAQFDNFKAYLREKLPPEVAYTEFK